MHTVQEKLFAWHKLYKDLEIAQSQMNSDSAGAQRADPEVRAQVERLRRESDSALAEVQTLMAQRRAAAPARTYSADAH